MACDICVLLILNYLKFWLIELLDILYSEILCSPTFNSSFAKQVLHV